MTIEVNERDITSCQCDTIVRSIADTITQTMNFKDEDLYVLSIGIDIHKVGESEPDCIDRDGLRARIEKCEADIREHTIMTLKEKFGVVSPSASFISERIDNSAK